MSSDGPIPPPEQQIAIEFHRILCEKHGLPFKAKWPSGYLIFALKGFQKVTALDGFWEDGTDNRDHKVYIEQALDKWPVCCRLGPRDLIELYTEADIGVEKTCVVCYRKGLGTPIETADRKYQHVCFSCVINRMIVTKKA